MDAPQLPLETACAVRECVHVMTLRREAVLRAGRLTLADLADLSVLPEGLRGKAAKLVLARFAPDRVPSAISLQPLLERARGMMPGLAKWLPLRAEGELILKSAGARASTGASSFGCLRVSRSVNAGDRTRSGDFWPAPCGAGRPIRAFAFDSALQMTRVTRPLTEGEIVVRYAGFGEPGVGAGDLLTLRVTSGPFRIERPVEAVQGVRGDARVFVRTSEGEVLSAALGGDLR